MPILNLQEIIQEYQDGSSLTKLAKKYKCCRNLLAKKLKLEGIVINLTRKWREIEGGGTP